jgi:hypothetical protein
MAGAFLMLGEIRAIFMPERRGSLGGKQDIEGDVKSEQQ